jgi:hypothetical protein
VSGDLESLVVPGGPFTHVGLSLHQTLESNDLEGIHWIPCEEIESELSAFRNNFSRKNRFLVFNNCVLFGSAWYWKSFSESL